MLNAELGKRYTHFKILHIQSFVISCISYNYEPASVILFKSTVLYTLLKYFRGKLIKLKVLSFNYDKY